MRPESPPEATHEPLIEIPDHLMRQVITGELVVSPRPANDHAVACSTLGSELLGPFQRGREGPGGWWIVGKPEMHFGGDVLVPDLAGWRRTRLPVVERAPFFSITPDWVCEVLSPATVGLDRVRKKRIYAREGVEHVWLVDPVGHTLETYQLQEGRWVELGSWWESDHVRAAPFDAIELELEALWLPGLPLPDL